MNKKKILVFLLGLLGSSVLLSQEKVVVLDFTQEELETQARILRTLTRTELVKTGRYTVIEDDYSRILTEMGRQNDGLTNSSTAVEIGKFLNAQYVVYGEILLFGNNLFINGNIVSVESAVITAAESFQINSGSYATDVRLVAEQMASALTGIPASSSGGQTTTTALPAAARRRADSLPAISFNGRTLYVMPEDIMGKHSFSGVEDIVADVNGTDRHGYNNWRLPDIDELQAIYDNRHNIGGFSEDWYWSSSERGSRSWFIHFGNGNKDYRSRHSGKRLRLVCD